MMGGREGEQSCTPRRLSDVSLWAWQRRISAVRPWMRAFLISVRRLVEFVWDGLKKLFAMETHRTDLPSQRMCPFCGLITARAKAFCLECGKALREVHP